VSQENIRDVIRALAAGKSVDWDVVDAHRGEETTRAILRGLRLVSRVGEVHGTIQRNLSEAAVEGAADRRSEKSSWGPFTLLERVGRGAYGDVYRAWDAKLDREVALKLLRQAGPDADTPVVEEGRMLARLRHPNVVTVHGADRIDGSVGIWMEFLEGRTLEELVREHGPFSAGEATSIGVEVCRGLGAVHAAGLVHGDVKAQNVMREDDGRIVLMDFGAGQHVREETNGQLAGTPLYLAPEVLEGSPATPRSDVYSLGVLLYYLLSARYPLRASSLRDVREAHRIRLGQSLSSIQPDLPKRLVEAIETLLRLQGPGASEVARLP
jgi:serine/threonine-protein kinase